MSVSCSPVLLVFVLLEKGISILVYMRRTTDIDRCPWTYSIYLYVVVGFHNEDVEERELSISTFHRKLNIYVKGI